LAIQLRIAQLGSLNYEKSRPVDENRLIEDEFAAAKACKDIG